MFLFFRVGAIISSIITEHLLADFYYIRKLFISHQKPLYLRHKPSLIVSYLKIYHLSQCLAYAPAIVIPAKHTFNAKVLQYLALALTFSSQFFNGFLGGDLVIRSALVF